MELKRRLVPSTSPPPTLGAAEAGGADLGLNLPALVAVRGP